MKLFKYIPSDRPSQALGQVFVEDTPIALVYEDVFYMDHTRHPVSRNLVDFINAARKERWTRPTTELDRYRPLLLDLLVTAWEGGSNYWAEVREPAGAEATFHKIVDEDYELEVYDVEDPTESWLVTTESMVRALYTVAEEYPDMYEDMLLGNFDAGIADVWFQLASIGELTFG